MSRKDVGDDLCHLEPLPRFDFRPVIANGSFTSKPVKLDWVLILSAWAADDRARSLRGGLAVPLNDMDPTHPLPDPTHSPPRRHAPGPTAKTAKT